MSGDAHLLRLPDLALVVLVGASGSGKSVSASKHFMPTEVLSSDRFRGWIDDDETSLDATADAFDALRYLAGIRLRRRRLTVVDATNVRKEDRAGLVALAKQHHALPIGIVLDLPLALCQQRNAERQDRQTPRDVIRRQHETLRRSLRSLKREGFNHVHILQSPEEVEALAIVREPLWPMRTRSDTGPFDIIGDVHGCAEELRELLTRLGWAFDENGVCAHPEGRRAVFIGDLVDRGPFVVEATRIALDLCDAGRAYWVPGNHDVRLLKRLRGAKCELTHGLAQSLEAIDSLPEDDRQVFVRRYVERVDGLVSHLVLDEGRLVVAHAGMREEMQGRASAEVRAFALYGATTGESDDFGLPVRLDWAQGYRGRAAVVYGHVAVREARWANNTVDIDTGCAFGGQLTALRWPERDLVCVGAAAVHFESLRPLRARPGEDGDAREGPLDVRDVMGKRAIRTTGLGRVTVRAEQAAAALELMSRFAVLPEWLIYLPPTMSPCETSAREDYLEHPDQALAYYRDRGVSEVVCEEKHMGSRTVVVLCRDEEVAARRFNVTTGATGQCFTRSGRRLFEEPLHGELIQRLRHAVTQAGLWDLLDTGWLCLDCELMPWNAKAQELLRSQYASVAVAGRIASAATQSALAAGLRRGLPLQELADRAAGLRANLEAYTRAYRQYCWPVRGIGDLRLAPFHLMASEGIAHTERDHRWHMEVLAQLAEADADLLVGTRWRCVDLEDPASTASALEWWEELTEGGGEGFVVKPLAFIARHGGKPVQPAVKCRGREYLRIIYGPDYTRPDHLGRLKERGLQRKRRLALDEFALGIEALRRFVGGEPLHRVHECVFGVLAMECEPVDPRL